MSEYILGIKASECKDDDKILCLLYQKYGRCRLDKLCKRVNMLNPLCFSDKCKQMFGDKINVVTINEEKYILYRCNKSCSYFLNINMEKFLKSLDRKDLIYGEELDNLLKNTNTKKNTTKSNTDIEYLKILLSYMKEEDV